ncbi:hypothetical protein AWB78_06208 [Caballeronia calidae]|uniref:Uncharacterized protein n=1 Tax=Caballeronia calidae TaxID=1777139 RepID=A0A158E4X7_9BURK|nr:hypothetical protein AWB78_06208 [Caballeronia calidae]
MTAVFRSTASTMRCYFSADHAIAKPALITGSHLEPCDSRRGAWCRPIARSGSPHLLVALTHGCCNPSKAAQLRRKPPRCRFIGTLLPGRLVRKIVKSGCRGESDSPISKGNLTAPSQRRHGHPRQRRRHHPTEARECWKTAKTKRRARPERRKLPGHNPASRLPRAPQPGFSAHMRARDQQGHPRPSGRSL